MRIKSITDIWFLVEQISVFMKLVKLHRLHDSSHYSKLTPLVLTSMLKSPITTVSYFSTVLLNEVVTSPKNVNELLISGGL